MRLAIPYNLREKSGAKIKNRQSYSNPRDQFFKATLFVSSSIYLQGRILTLIRFFDSDQKQIKNIYRYQI